MAVDRDEVRGYNGRHAWYGLLTMVILGAELFRMSGESRPVISPEIQHKVGGTVRNLPPPPLASEDRVQFVLMVGLEGTGHHFMETLVENSPMRNKRKELGNEPEYTKKLTTGLYVNNAQNRLWGAHCNLHQKNIDVVQAENSVVQTLKEIRKIALDARKDGRLDPDSVLRIPINTSPGVGNGFGMQSFPNFKGSCRKLNFPSLDLLYGACRKAQVDCRHVYLYRDPKQILRSTTVKRHFNEGKIPAVHLYKTLLQVIATEMTVYNTQTLGCMSFYDKSPENDWKGIVRQLWGWTNTTEYDALMSKLYDAPSEPENDDWLPANMEPYVKVFYEAHNYTLDVCRSGPYRLLETSPPEN